MEINNLWNKITPINLDRIKDDLKDGKVPELPYFIIDMEDAKKEVGKKLNLLDQKFQYCYVTANYGNGKTNLLKYLKLFFQQSDHRNDVKVIYARADVDRFDIILFLLYLIQENLILELLESIKYVYSNKWKYISQYCNRFEDTFAPLESYIKKFHEFLKDEEELKNLIYLGTGRLYTRGSFSKYGLDKLTDYNRREILVFFLNILAANNKYCIFEIDEIEKIQEKSKVRFQNFLTSYRELFDLSSHINGHCLLTAATDASGNSTMSLDSYNPAFARRIETHKIELPVIDKIEDLKELGYFLNELLETGKDAEEVDKIAVLAKTQKFTQNNRIIKALCSSLVGEETLSLEELLDKYDLNKIYKKTLQELEEENAFLRLNQKFFDPLEEYIQIISYENTNYTFKTQGDQALIDKENKIVQVFLFNNDIEPSLNRIQKVQKEQQNYKIKIYTPEMLDLSSSVLMEKGIENFEIITYDPKVLMTLLVIHRDENLVYGEKLQEIIHQYTHNNL